MADDTVSPTAPSKQSLPNVSHFTGHSDTVLCLDVRSNLVASGSEDNSARIWDLRSGRCVRCVKGFPDAVTSVKFNPSEKREHAFALASGDTLYEVDLRRAEVILTAAHCSTLLKSEDEVNECAWNHDGSMLATADDGGQVCVWSADQKKHVRTLRKHENICTSVLFRPSSAVEIVSGGLDSSIYRCDYTKMKTIQQLSSLEPTPSGAQTLNPPFVHSLCCISGRFDAGSSKARKHASKVQALAAGLGDGCILLSMLRGKDCSIIARFKGHASTVAHVTASEETLSWGPWSPILSAGNDRAVVMWDINELMRLRDQIPRPEKASEAKQEEPAALAKATSKADGDEKIEKSERAAVSPWPFPLDSIDTAPEVRSMAMARWRVRRKPNWISATSSNCVSPSHLILADTSPRIALWSLS